MYFDIRFWVICFGIPGYMFFSVFFYKKRLSKKLFIWYSLFYIYLIGLVGVTFFPIDFSPDLLGRNVFQGQLGNFLKDIHEYTSRGMWQVPLKQVGGNLILLFPFAIFLVSILQKPKTYISAFLTGFYISFTIESLQLFLSIALVPGRYKIFDVDDLLLNTIGFLVGFIIFKIFSRIHSIKSLQ